MQFHLRNFNDEEIEIDENTLHHQVLSASDGFGTASSKNIYKAVIRWTLKRNGHIDKAWPNDWFENSVNYLASNILES